MSKNKYAKHIALTNSGEKYLPLLGDLQMMVRFLYLELQVNFPLTAKKVAKKTK